MLQWLGVGWILGLTTMGWSKAEYQLSAGSVCLIMLVWLLIYRVIHLRLHHVYLRFISILFSLSLSFLLAQGFANHALDQQLQFIEKEVGQREVIVYISRLNKINTNIIQQPLQVLQPNGTIVQWLGSVKQEGPVQAVFNMSNQLQLGQYYRLNGDVRPAHAYATPGAFDVEKWYLEQNESDGRISYSTDSAYNPARSLCTRF